MNNILNNEIDDVLLALSKIDDNADYLTQLRDLAKGEEFQKINQYIHIKSILGYNPDMGYIMREFNIQSIMIETFDEKVARNVVDMYIKHLASERIAFGLTNAAESIRTNGITEKNVKSIEDLIASSEIADQHKNVLIELKEIYEGKEYAVGISTGVKVIDELTGGLQPGMLTTLMGYAGQCKTTWAANIAYNALKEGKNVVYLSLEVPKEHIAFNLLSRHSYNSCYEKPIKRDDIKKKRLSELALKLLWERIAPEFQDLSKGLFILDETDIGSYGTYNLRKILTRIDDESIEKTGRGIDLVVLDHIQLLKFDEAIDKRLNLNEVINRYVSFFRKQAMNYLGRNRKVSVLLASQASRTGWKEAVKHDGSYQLTALAESNELERSSQIVLSVFKDESLILTHEVKVQLLKSRDGETMLEPISVFCDPEYYAFGDGFVANASVYSNFDISSIINSEEPINLNKMVNDAVSKDKINDQIMSIE